MDKILTPEKMLMVSARTIHQPAANAVRAGGTQV